MLKLFYLIGIPGSGKTTLMDALLGHLKFRVFANPFLHKLYKTEPALVQLGSNRAQFRGTDTLPFNIQPKVLKFLSTNANKDLTVIGEGDRLSNRSFFDSMDQWGIQLTIAHLNTPDEIAAQRRAARGSDQDPSWVRGRITKVNNLVKAGYVTPGWALDGSLPLADLVTVLQQYPPFAELGKE